MSLELPNEPELLPLLDDETFSQLTSYSSHFPSEHDDSITSPNDLESSQTTSSTSFLRQRPVRSWIYQHGTLTTYKGKRVWECQLCGSNPQRYAYGTTSHLMKHLLKVHKITEQGPLATSGSTGGNNIPNVLQQAFANTLPKIPFKFTLFQELLLRWMVSYNISFRQVEDNSFRMLLSYLTAVVSSYNAIPHSLPKSGDTICSWVCGLFMNTKDKLKTDLLSAPFSIHFTFDLWTSPNHIAFMGIVGHWVNKDGKSKRALLALPTLTGIHSGENQAEAVWKVIEKYELGDNIGFFTLDNATNNDTCLETLRGMFLYLISTKYTNKKLDILEEKQLPMFDPVEHRLQCFGHIINLAVKAFLLGLKEDKGPYSRLKAVITYICWTPQRRNEFKKIAQTDSPFETAFLPITNNVTRWNSDFRAIKRAIRLQSSIDIYITTVRQRTTNSNSTALEVITSEDWNLLRDIVQILEPFHQLTLDLQGHRENGTLYDICPAMDSLLSHLEETQGLFSESTILVQSLQLAWEKLRKCYTLADLNPVLYAAVALHPSMR